MTSSKLVKTSAIVFGFLALVACGSSAPSSATTPTTSTNADRPCATCTSKPPMTGQSKVYVHAIQREMDAVSTDITRLDPCPTQTQPCATALGQMNIDLNQLEQLLDFGPTSVAPACQTLAKERLRRTAVDLRIQAGNMIQYMGSPDLRFDRTVPEQFTVVQKDAAAYTQAKQDLIAQSC